MYALSVCLPHIRLGKYNLTEGIMEKTIGIPVATLKAHLALNVRSVERSIAFYRNLFGIEPSKVRSGYAKFDVRNPPLNLSLNEVPFTDRGALSHLGIQVASTDDVMAVREGWIAAGLITRDEMGTNCCYAVQDKTWAFDPDGNEWEVFVVLEDNLTQTTMCCLPDANGVSSCEVPASVTIPVAEPVAAGCEPGSGCC